MDFLSKLIDKYSGHRLSDGRDGDEESRSGKGHSRRRGCSRRRASNIEDEEIPSSSYRRVSKLDEEEMPSSSHRRVSKTMEEEMPNSSHRRHQHRRPHDQEARQDIKAPPKPSHPDKDIQGATLKPKLVEEDKTSETPTIPEIMPKAPSPPLTPFSREGPKSPERNLEHGLIVEDEAEVIEKGKGKERRRPPAPQRECSPKRHHHRRHRRRSHHLKDEGKDLSEREILERQADRRMDETRKAMERDRRRREERSDRQRR